MAPTPPIELMLVMALAGLILGFAYFVALRRTISLFVGGRGWFGPVVLTVGRLAVMAVALTVAARLGAMPLLAAFVGFLAARFVAVRAVRMAA